MKDTQELNIGQVYTLTEPISTYKIGQEVQVVGYTRLMALVRIKDTELKVRRSLLR